MDTEFGCWLAGFVAGEGHFFIRKQNAGGYACGFGVKLRVDDLPVLEEIRARVGHGRIYCRDGWHNSNPQADWKVADRTGCAALVEIFDRYPLRAKKAGDFFIWREAVAEWMKVRPSMKGFDWSQMAHFKARLEECRQFGALEPWFVTPAANEQMLLG